MSISTVAHVQARTGSVHFWPQNCLFVCGDLDPNLIHSSLCPPKSTSQVASRSVSSAVFAGLTVVTDRQSQATPSVAIGCKHVASAAMRPKITSHQEAVAVPSAWMI